MAKKTESNLLNEFEAAAHIRMSVAFLRQGRSRGILAGRTPSPKFLKLGYAVRYDKRDLDEWLAARVVDPVARAESRAL